MSLWQPPMALVIAGPDLASFLRFTAWPLDLPAYTHLSELKGAPAGGGPHSQDSLESQRSYFA